MKRNSSLRRSDASTNLLRPRRWDLPRSSLAIILRMRLVRRICDPVHQPSVRWAVLPLPLKPTRPQAIRWGVFSGKELQNAADHRSDSTLEAAGGRGDGLAAAGDKDRLKDPKSALPSEVDVPEGSTIDAEIAQHKKQLKIIGEGRAALEARQRAADGATGRKPSQERNPRGGPAYELPIGVPKDKAQCNFTDPESRIMKTSQHSFRQAYSAQTVVESEHQLIVETCVRTQPRIRSN